MVLSIITINYNNKKGLEETLDSIYKQVEKDFELIIIDGGSTDGSVDVINKYKERFPCLYYVSEKDKGIYNAMNKGIERVSSDYCIFMNSGDCFYDNYSIEKSMEFLNGKWDIVSGVAISDRYIMNPPTSEQLSLSFFLKSSLNHQATYISTELLRRLRYNENLRIVSDTEFFFKALIINNSSYLNIPVKVAFCDAAGASGNLSASLSERYHAIKELLPQRMKYDVDFIIKHHNSFILFTNKIFYNNFWRRIYNTFIRRGKRT